MPFCASSKRLLRALTLLSVTARVVRLAAAQRIAVSIQTYSGNHHMVESSRDTWRKGITTVVITNGTTERRVASPSEHEVWFEAPDLPNIGWNNPRCCRCPVFNPLQPLT